VTGYGAASHENGNVLVDMDWTLAPAGTVLSGAHAGMNLNVPLSSGDSTFTMADGARIDAGTGSIIIDMGGDITLSGLATSGNVSVTSINSSILDGGDSATDITGAGVSLSAVNGSLGAFGDALSFAVGSLTTNTSTGGGSQFLSEADSVTFNTSSAGAGTIDLEGGRFDVGGGQTATAATVNVLTGATLGGEGTVDGAVTAGGAVSPGFSPGMLSTGSVTFSDNSSFNLEIGGTTTGSGAGFHDQLTVSGTVTIGNNVALNRAAFDDGSGSDFVPQPGEQFVIIDTTGGVTGTFAGLGEGATITDFLSSGLDALITYQGGLDDNDVALTTVISSIHGLKYDDVDADGVYTSGTDLLLPGVTFTLTGTDSAGTVVNQTAVTDANGEFAFTGLASSVAEIGAGTGYTVTETVPAGHVTTTATSYSNNVAGGQQLVALAGQSGAEPPQTEVVVGAGLMFGNHRPRDYGDAPELGDTGFTNSYPTLLSDDGARHIAIASGPRLGAARDTETNGLPDANAVGDDNDNTDDEDGITWLTTLLISDAGTTSSSVEVDLQNADAASNRLDAWIDFNRDGVWDDVTEKITDDFDLGTTDGLVTVPFTIPQDIGENVESGDTFARFRLSTTGGLLPTGLAYDGEAEDYQVTLAAASGGATINPPTSGDGDLKVDIGGGNLVITQGGTTLFSAPANEVGGVTLNGTAGDDVLDIDDSSDIPASGLTFNAGAGNDDLIVDGSNMAFEFTDTAGTGSVAADGRTINFTGVEPNTITLLNGATVTLNLTGGDTVTFTEVTATRTRAQGGANAVEFDNPSTQLVVNMQDGNNYTLNFTDLAANFNPTNGIDINGNSGQDKVRITDLGDSLTNAIDIDLAGNASDSVAFLGLSQTPSSLSITAEWIGQSFGSGAALTVSGATTLDAGPSGFIGLTLTPLANDFGGAVTITNADKAWFTDTNDITFAAVTTQGEFSVNAGGAVALSGTTTVGGDADINSTGAITDSGNVSVTGNADFNGSTITLGGAAETTNFGSLKFSSAGAVSISEVSATTVSGASTAGGLMLVSADDVTLDATVNVTGNTSITAGTTTGGIDVNAKLTGSGTILLNAADEITIDGAIDPTTVTMEADDDITISAAVSAENLITVSAGQDGSGSVILSGTGSLVADNTGNTADVAISTGGTSGDVVTGHRSVF